MNNKMNSAVSAGANADSTTNADVSSVSQHSSNTIVMRRRVNCITINTDASFHPVHKVGGYAFYIVCDLFKIQKGGKFKNNPKTAQQAEEMCIGNAIATLLAQKELPEAKYLIIKGDCQYAFSAIKCAGKKTLTSAGTVKKLLNKLIRNTAFPNFEFRYVKAHNDSPDARSWVNEWCDNEAKKWMRNAVSEVCA